MFCICSCGCIEPVNPSNATLQYWEQNNITASEIYWEALEVQVNGWMSNSWFELVEAQKTLFEHRFMPKSTIILKFLSVHFQLKTIKNFSVVSEIWTPLYVK